MIGGPIQPEQKLALTVRNEKTKGSPLSVPQYNKMTLLTQKKHGLEIRVVERKKN
jgi:hypothetical protein